MASIAPRDATTRDGRAFVIRTAEQADAEAIFAMERASVAEGRWTITAVSDPPDTPEAGAEQIRLIRDDPASLALVADAGRRAIAVAKLKAGTRARTRHRVSLGITVDAAWRDKGVGRALIEALLAWAAGEPRIEKVCLGVLATNARAIALYRSLGFAEEGRQPREFRLEDGTFVDNVLMFRPPR